MNKIFFFMLAVGCAAGAFNKAPVSVEVVDRSIFFMNMKLDFVEFVLRFNEDTSIAGMRFNGTSIDYFFPVNLNLIYQLQGFGGLDWTEVMRDAVSFSCGENDPIGMDLCYNKNNEGDCTGTWGCRWEQDKGECRSSCRGPCMIHQTLPALKDAVYWQFQCDNGNCEPTIDPHRLTFFLFREGRDLMTDQKMVFIPEGDYTPDEVTAAKFLDGTCKLHLNPNENNRIAVFPTADTTKEQQHQHMEIADSPALSAVVPAPVRSCDYQCIEDLNDEYELTLQEARGLVDVDRLEKFNDNLESVFGRDCYFNCISLMTDSVTFSDVEVSYTTDHCVYPEDSPQFDVDPCCNNSLLLHDCCSASRKDFTIRKMTGVNEISAMQNCPAAVTVEQQTKLLNILEGFSKADGFVKDCSRQSMERLASKDYQALMDAANKVGQDCIEEVYGNDGRGKECTQDIDCLSGHCSKPNLDEDEGNCAVTPEASRLMLVCLANELNVEVFSKYKEILGIVPADSEAEEEAKFDAKSKQMNCNGPNAWTFKAGWYYNFSSCVHSESVKAKPEVMSMQQASRRAREVFKRLERVHGPKSAARRRHKRRGVEGAGVEKAKPLVRKNEVQPLGSGDGGDEGGDDMSFCEQEQWAGDNGKVRCWENNPEESGHCYYDASSKALCEAEKACNHQYTWSHNGEDNVTELCLEDRLGNGGKFCGICYGEQWCEDISKRPYCTYHGDFMSDKTKCDALGGHWELWDGWMDVCSLESTPPMSMEDCWGGCFDEDGPQPAPHQLCIFAGEGPPEREPGSYREEWFSFRDSVTREWRSETIYVVDHMDPEGCAGEDGFEWRNVFEETNWAKMDRCERSYCYNYTIANEADCNAIQMEGAWFHWEPILRNGSGACVGESSGGSWDLAAMKENCEGAGWTFWTGRTYQQGAVFTKSECDTQGYCSIPHLRNLNQAECEATGHCSRGCRTCNKPYDEFGNGMCVNSTTADCLCENNTICAECDFTDQYPSAMECVGANKKWIECLQFNEDECRTDNFSLAMECEVQWGMCHTEAECQLAGECNDWYLFDHSKAQQYMEAHSEERWEDLMRSDMFGVCVIEKTFNDWGYYGCDWEFVKDKNNVHMMDTPLGCVITGLLDGECEQEGGTVLHHALNKDQCEAGGSGCCEPWANCRQQLTPKTAEECAACGGTMQPYRKWKNGKWDHGKMVIGEWKKREWAPLNKWENTVENSVVRQHVVMAAASFILDVMEQGLRCRSGVLLGLIRQYSALCGTNLDGSAAVLLGSAVSSELFDGNMACGTVQTLEVAGFTVQLTADSCTQTSSVKITLSAQMVAASTGGDSPASLHSHVLSQVVKPASLKTDAACYAQVQESATSDKIVGQLLGDCLVWTPSGALSSVTVCLGVDASIPWDTETFPTKGICTAEELSTGATAYYKSTASVTESGASICVTVSSATTICPVAYVSGNPTLSVCSNTQMASLAEALVTLEKGAAALKFNSQPSSDAKAGSALSAFQVHFVDETGAKVVATAAATLALKSGTGTAGALLTGSTRVTAVDGVAEFDDVKVSKSGTGFVLVVASGTLVVAESEPFNVQAGDPVRLKFHVQPAGCAVNTPCLQQPVVHIVDSENNLCTAPSTETVTLSLPAGVTCTGTLTLTAAAGVVTFSSLQFAAGTDVTFTASSADLMSTTSTEFDVVAATGYPLKLAFETQPQTTDADALFDLTVAMQDGTGATVTTATGSVTLMFEAGTNAAGAALGGSVSAAAVDGVVSFTGLSVSRAGLAYKLVTVNTLGLAEATSNAFKVRGAADLSFDVIPTTAEIKKAFKVAVSVRDLGNKVFTTADDSITLAIKPGTGAPGVVMQGSRVRKPANGVAEFNDLVIEKEGKYTLIAVTPNGLSSESSEVTLTAAGGAGDSSSLSTGAIVGIAVAGVVVVAALILLALFLTGKLGKRPQREEGGEEVSERNIEMGENTNATE